MLTDHRTVRRERWVRHELNLTPSQKDALRLLADRRRRSVNELIRQAVDSYLGQEG